MKLSVMVMIAGEDFDRSLIDLGTAVKSNPEGLPYL